MIWPVQKTGLPYNIVRFPNGPQRLLFVRMISAMLRRSGGDAGAFMFEAYRHIVSDTNQARRSYMLDLLESVRHDYVHGGYT